MFYALLIEDTKLLIKENKLADADLCQALENLGLAKEALSSKKTEVALSNVLLTMEIILHLLIFSSTILIKI